MHATAMSNARDFFATYAPGFPEGQAVRVVDLGAQDVNGSLREACPGRFEYVGVDFVAGRNVDVVLDDPYKLPFPDATVDVLVSSSCFEHSELFWLVFLEILRVLRPHGLFYLNAPSRGPYHRYPVDCWRFYPDSARALATWGERNGYHPAVLESYTQVGGDWSDCVAVFQRDGRLADRHPRRILETKTDFTNGRIGTGPLRNPREAGAGSVEREPRSAWRRLVRSLRPARSRRPG